VIKPEDKVEHVTCKGEQYKFLIRKYERRDHFIMDNEMWFKAFVNIIMNFRVI
jgi:hypothetical protein